MALSEQEQRLLEEMERNLYNSGQDRVVRVDAQNISVNVRLLVIGIVVVVLGIGTLIAGSATGLPVIGVAGFVVMFVGALLALNAPKSKSTREESGLR